MNVIYGLLRVWPFARRRMSPEERAARDSLRAHQFVQSMYGASEW
jgi:hypothetical protein